MIGSDDVLACFIAGNVFTWDDWFRLETMDDSLQPTIDMLLNVGVFMWFGAVCPWHMFVDNNAIPIYRLIPLGILVLLLRRLPMILAFHKFIHQVDDLRRALFLGFFGPIGVSAIFYLYISKEFLRDIVYEGQEREDASHLSEVLDVVVWFLVVCSIVVHGLSIPLGKLGFYLPRTFSTALSSERVSLAQSTAREGDARINQESTSDITSIFRRRRQADSPQISQAPTQSHTMGHVPSGLARAGKNVLNDVRLPPGGHGEDSSSSKSDGPAPASENDESRPQISGPMNPRAIGRAVVSDSSRDTDEQTAPTNAAEAPGGFQRSIRFGDEEAAA